MRNPDFNFDLGVLSQDAITPRSGLPGAQM
jgi:hypothetical protein